MSGAATEESPIDCADSQSQAEWTAGIEAWDVALGFPMEFDEVSGACDAPPAPDNRVMWESGQDYCAPSNYGCHKASCNFHGAHCDLTPGSSRILFDVVNYAAPDTGGYNEMPDTFEARKFGMLHEWSHVVGLTSHNEAGYDCNGAPQPGVPTVTDGDVNLRVAQCPQSPGSRDVGSVLWNVYGCRPNGAFVHTPSTVYVIQGNQKRHVPDSVVLATWSDFSDVIPITDDEAKAYLDGAQVGFRPEKLISDSSNGLVYFITNEGGDWLRGYKRYVTSPAVLSQCFPNLPIMSVSSGLANIHLNGSNITSCPTNPNGAVAYVPNVAVYLMAGGQKRWVISQAVQNSWFFGLDGVPLYGFPTQADNIGFRPGRLIRKSSTGEIFLVTNEGDFGRATKRYVSNPTTLNCLFPGEPWIEASNDEANNHPTGAPLNIPAC